MLDLIEKLYSYSEHRDSKLENAISTTTLMGPLYKSKLYLAKTPKNEDLIDFKFKRSSMIGSAVHAWAEKALADDKSIIQEIYMERQVEVNGTVYTVSGSCDILQRIGEDEWQLGDFKTAYGTSRKADALKKDALQMSIYRWLLQSEYKISDTAYSLFISQSNNNQDAYAVDLIDLEDIEYYIANRLEQIVGNENCDCKDGVKFNMCNYCSYEDCQYRA